MTSPELAKLLREAAAASRALVGGRLAIRLTTLKDRCLRCWAVEVADFFPSVVNTKMAAEELRRCGNPDCHCGGLARLKFRESGEGK